MKNAVHKRKSDGKFRRPLFFFNFATLVAGTPYGIVNASKACFYVPVISWALPTPVRTSYPLRKALSMLFRGEMSERNYIKARTVTDR